VILRACQQLNFQNGTYVDWHNNFIKKTSGCSECGVLLNELFQDGKRKNKDLLVIAIDFSNAIGSVPHNLIVSTLKQLNFRIWGRAIIKDMYDNAQTTMEHRRGQTDSMK
jgi:hypothetical protein